MSISVLIIMKDIMYNKIIDYWLDPLELYVLTEEGYERKVSERLLRIRKNKNKA
ncbi:MAG: hypothetical protein Nk1A_9190 [Endomicrobiia bacterium]|nr:MAG: hypothetical protein Nk1A_9190 [Endomicrobiia bacterium]